MTSFRSYTTTPHTIQHTPQCEYSKYSTRVYQQQQVTSWHLHCRAWRRQWYRRRSALWTRCPCAPRDCAGAGRCHQENRISTSTHDSSMMLLFKEFGTVSYFAMYLDAVVFGCSDQHGFSIEELDLADATRCTHPNKNTMSTPTPRDTLTKTLTVSVVHGPH
jgi:hypothetical protein